jgi:hypothetical protein
VPSARFRAPPAACGHPTPRRPFCAAADASDSINGKGGWVLVDFPKTAAQARLLEKALSGFEV